MLKFYLCVLLINHGSIFKNHMYDIITQMLSLTLEKRWLIKLLCKHGVKHSHFQNQQFVVIVAKQSELQYQWWSAGWNSKTHEICT